MQVSIVIVNYNTKKLLHKCLKSIYELTAGVSFEVIVVDNASLDGSEYLIKSRWTKVHFIQNSVNLGFGAANNIGANVAQGQYLFFLNSDTLLLNNAVKILSDYMDQHPRIGVCCGNLYTPNLKPTISFSQHMPGISQEIHSFFGEIFTRIKYKGNIYFNHGNKALKINGSISGADFMIPRKLFQELEGFDADFFLYYEETELIYRIRKRKMEAVNIPDAKIIHLEGSSETIKEKTIMHSFKSKYLYYQKTGKGKQIKLSHKIFQATAWQRTLIFTLIGNKRKAEYWKQLLQLENKIYMKWLT